MNRKSAISWIGGGLTRNGWLYPCVCVARQLADDWCPSPDTTSTYYPMKSKLADDGVGGTAYPGSYLYVTYHLETW